AFISVYYKEGLDVIVKKLSSLGVHRAASFLSGGWRIEPSSRPLPERRRVNAGHSITGAEPAAL
ncbi:MAG: hypothetical protein R6W83_08025, partial [Cryobacterium sp.]